MATWIIRCPYCGVVVSAMKAPDGATSADMERYPQVRAALRAHQCRPIGDPPVRGKGASGGRPPVGRA